MIGNCPMCGKPSFRKYKIKKRGNEYWHCIYCDYDEEGEPKWKQKTL